MVLGFATLTRALRAATGEAKASSIQRSYEEPTQDIQRIEKAVNDKKEELLARARIDKLVLADNQSSNRQSALRAKFSRRRALDPAAAAAATTSFAEQNKCLVLFRRLEKQLDIELHEPVKKWTQAVNGIRHLQSDVAAAQTIVNRRQDKLYAVARKLRQWDTARQTVLLPYKKEYESWNRKHDERMCKLSAAQQDLDRRKHHLTDTLDFLNAEFIRIKQLHAQGRFFEIIQEFQEAIQEAQEMDQFQSIENVRPPGLRPIHVASPIERLASRANSASIPPHLMNSGAFHPSLAKATTPASAPNHATAALSTTAVSGSINYQRLTPPPNLTPFSPPDTASTFFSTRSVFNNPPAPTPTHGPEFAFPLTSSNPLNHRPATPPLPAAHLNYAPSHQPLPNSQSSYPPTPPPHPSSCHSCSTQTLSLNSPVRKLRTSGRNKTLRTMLPPQFTSPAPKLLPSLPPSISNSSSTTPMTPKTPRFASRPFDSCPPYTAQIETTVDADSAWAQNMQQGTQHPRSLQQLAQIPERATYDPMMSMWRVQQTVWQGEAAPPAIPQQHHHHLSYNCHQRQHQPQQQAATEGRQPSLRDREPQPRAQFRNGAPCAFGGGSRTAYDATTTAGYNPSLLGYPAPSAPELPWCGHTSDCHCNQVACFDHMPVARPGSAALIPYPAVPV